MKINRAEFLRQTLMLGIASQIPFFFSCTEEDIVESEILTNDELKLIRSVQEILFPAFEDSPSAKDIKADKYLLWVLSDKKIDSAENEFIINGINWLNETSHEEYNIDYNDLNQEQKEDLIELISNENWGQNWLSRLLTLIFEALFADPIYGSNPNEIGWKWLNHNPGFPRPNATQIYIKA